MVVRRINRTPKKILHKGGDIGDSDIPFAQANPDPNEITIPDIVLWIKVRPELIKKSTIKSYIETQILQDELREQFKNSLDEVVITEIISDVSSPQNSLVRFELEPGSWFPTLSKNSSGMDVISMNFIKDISGSEDVGKAFKLCTKNPVHLDPMYSMWSISKNVTFEYNKTLGKFIVDIDHIAFLKENVAEFSEIIVFSRKLNLNETQQMEGYMAIKKDEVYALPLNHPYLKDMSYLPELSDPIANIQEIQENTKKGIEEFNRVLDSKRSQYELNKLFNFENTNRGKLTDILIQLNKLKQMLSKGALLSIKRGPTTLDTIFQAINDLAIITVPFTKEYFNSKLAEYIKTLVDVNEYIQLIQGLSDFQGVGGGEEINNNAINTAKSQEILNQTALSAKAREFYQALRTRTNKINDLGANLYAPMNKKLNDQISAINDYAIYSNSTTSSEMKHLLVDFKDIDAQISTKNWLSYIPSINTNIIDTKTRRNQVISIQYQNTFLNTIQNTYESVRNQLQEGDMAFIQSSTANKTMELNAIYEDIEKNTIKPIWHKTFLPHCKQRYCEIDTCMQKFKILLPLVKGAIKSLKTILDWCKQNKSPASLDSIPVVPTQTSFRQEDVYIRKVCISDANLTGIEYIVTDSQGVIIQEPNINGEMDVSYIFPSYQPLVYNKDDSRYVLNSTYKNESGIQTVQTFNILNEFPSAISVIDSLPELRKPNYWFHKTTNLFELPREQGNGIHQFILDSIEYPIQLPKYALELGTYFVIQNVGKNSIQVQIPGFPNDMTDMIGPQDSVLYIYSEFKQTDGNSYYGRVYLRDGYIPYDTLLNCPRSEYSVYVNELNAEIYVKDTLEPLYDLDGYFVQAIPDSNGYVYDIDDVYSANPYKVKSVKQMHLSDFARNSKLRPPTEATEIFVAEDTITGLPVLCNSKGLPGINEFGFAKFAKGPLTFIDGKTHLRGAPERGDLVLKPFQTGIQSLAMLESFITFETIYRTQFVKPYTDLTKYIFVTHSNYPILSAGNTYIDSMARTITSTEITYSDSGKNSNAYVVSLDPVLNGSISSVPHRFFLDIVNQNEMKKACTIILNRYDTNKLFIINCLSVINGIYDDIAKFGKSQSEDMIASLQDAYKQLNADIKEYNTYSSIVQGIQNVLNGEAQEKKQIQNDVKVSIDMLDLKMRELILSCWDTFKSIETSVEFFKKLMQDVKNITDSASKFRRVTVVDIEQRIGSVQARIQSDSQSMKVTSSPDIDRFLKLMIEYKLDFLQKLGDFENSLMNRPKYSSEYTAWITDKKGKIKQIHLIYNKIKAIADNEIPDAFNTRKVVLQQQISTTIQQLQKQIQSYVGYSNAIQLWLGINNEQYSQNPPIINTGNPSIKGITIDLIVFNELMNPSVIRDWKVSDSDRIQSELLDPIESLKILVKDTFSEIQMPIVIEDSLRTSSEIDTLNEKLQTITEVITNFETKLQPILKSYESVRSDIRNTLKTNLQQSVNAIHSRWIAITGKRTALLTLSAADASTPRVDFDTIFTPEIESKVQDVLQGYTNPTYYDSLAYFKLKGELDKHTDVNGNLDKIESVLKTM